MRVGNRPYGRRRGTGAVAHRRARGAAVALVLAAGVVATAATSPPEDPPCTSSSEVSAFFGPQEEDSGEAVGNLYWQVESGPFVFAQGRVTVPTCAADHVEDGHVTVQVEYEVYEATSSLDLESFLRATLLVDGEGAATPADSVQVSTVEGSSLNGAPGRDVLITFAVPLDIAEPVALRLPEVDGEAVTGRYLEPIPLRIGEAVEQPLPTTSLPSG